jgi:hypothetical protein
MSVACDKVTTIDNQSWINIHAMCTWCKLAFECQFSFLSNESHKVKLLLIYYEGDYGCNDFEGIQLVHQSNTVTKLNL